MGQAIGQVLSLAVGAAISPMPIIAAVLLLLTPRAAATGTAYTVGWLLGMFALGVVVLLIAHPADASSNGTPATWVSVLELVLALVVFGAAVKQWRSRPRDGSEPPPPKWMGAIESFSVGKASIQDGCVRSAPCRCLLSPLWQPPSPFMPVRRGSFPTRVRATSSSARARLT